mmetsp:Transcript_281/g.538  ORF Transcript_281/g.538 Transcript_281/m.538 type:complete len:312 (+) Transcript_281:174-1109(+)
MSETENKIKKHCDSMDTMDDILSCGSCDVASIDLEMNSSDDEMEEEAKRPIGRLSALTDYLKSHRAFELALCLTFFLVTNVSPLVKFQVYQRPLPVQHFQATNTFVKNLTNNETFDGETVPHEVLILVSGILPLVLQIVLSVGCRWWAPIKEVHRTLCVYFLAWSLNMIACEFVKSYVGYFRPMFFQLCEPNENFTACTGESVNSGRRSFPSGHATTAFCGMTILGLYIHTRLGLRSKRAKKNVPDKRDSDEDSSHALARLVSVLALIPLFVALWIAASRVRDNKHFPADILGGALLGSSLATYCFGLWFD